MLDCTYNIFCIFLDTVVFVLCCDSSHCSGYCVGHVRRLTLGFVTRVSENTGLQNALQHSMADLHSHW